MSKLEITRGEWVKRRGRLGIDVIIKDSGFGIIDFGTFRQLKDAEYLISEANGCLCWFIAFMAASFFWIAIYLIFVR